MRSKRPVLILCLLALIVDGHALSLDARAVRGYEPSFMQLAGETESAPPKNPPSPGVTNSDQTDSVSVVRIDFRKEEDGTEKVFIGLNRHHIPRTFTIEGDKPRVVIDIKNVSIWKGRPKIPVNGKLIKQIRTHLHRHTKTLRLVLDLNLSMDYTVSPAFYPAENIYCITVR